MVGFWTPGVTAAALPLTGSELVPADTQLASGLNPQSEAISLANIKNFVLGNTAVTNGTSAAGAITLTGSRGTITTESLSTAALATYTLTVTDTSILATDIVLVSLATGTSNAGTPILQYATPAAGSLVIKVYNAHATVALNGTLVISFVAIH